MNFKKPKQDVINEATNEMRHILDNAFYNLKQGYISKPHGSNIDMIQDAIIEGFRRAITSLVMNTYTDQEFEEDLNLRSKG